MKSQDKNIIEDDFFDYLSEKNIDKVTTDDLNDLFKRIDNKTSVSNFKKSTNGFYIVLVSSFTLILLFCLFNKRTIVQIAPQIIEEVKPKVISSIDTANSILVSSIPEENYFTPEKNKSLAQTANESAETPNNTDALNISVDPMDMKSTSLNDSTSITKQEIDLLLLPNASVYYIYDLKITEYQKLYFKKLKPFVLNIENLSAQFENTDSYTNYLKEKGKDMPYTLDMLLKDALKAFNKKKYNQSILLFQELLDYNLNDPNANFYGGLSYFNDGNYSAAINKFDKVLELENNTFHQEAKWYKGLAYLKQNNRNEAIKVFINVAAQKGFYASRAEEKLMEMSANK